MATPTPTAPAALTFITDMSDSDLDALLGMEDDDADDAASYQSKIDAQPMDPASVWLRRHDLNEPAAICVLGRGPGVSTRSGCAFVNFKRDGEIFTAAGEMTDLGEAVRASLIAGNPEWARGFNAGPLAFTVKTGAAKGWITLS